MISPSILFRIPAEFEAGYTVGQFVRYGGILKDASSGRIVGHLQETGLLQSTIQSALSGDFLNPVNAVSSLVGVVQNEQMKRKLDALQATLGGMQTLQLATMVSSIAGIGVTAASTAIILNRIHSVDTKLRAVEGKIDALPAQWRELSLQNALSKIETQLERLQEVPYRLDARPVVVEAEAALHDGFNTLHRGLMQIVSEQNIDADLLRTLLAGLSLCAGAQIKSLFLLNEMETAARRSRRQVEKLEQLALEMPRDMIAARVKEGAEGAETVFADMRELRHRFATQPALCDALIKTDVEGSEYVRRVEEEEEQPLLILPAA